jgi:hypothetical protein
MTMKANRAVVVVGVVAWMMVEAVAGDVQGNLAFAKPPPATRPTIGAIAGVVTNRRTGAPEAGVTVLATSPAHSSTSRAATDAQGVYSLGGLPPGVYSVAFDPPGHEQRDRVRVFAGKTTSVDLQVMLGSIGGVVTDAKTGKPAAGAEVVAESYGTTTVQLKATTRADGRYAIAVLPGDYNVTASLAGLWAQQDPVLVADGKIVVANLALGQRPVGEDLMVQEDSADAGELMETPRAAARGWLVEPKGSWSLGGALRFLMASGGLGTTSVHFGDAVLLGLSGSWSPTDWNQILAGVSLLPMQPTDSREWAWQGDSLGDRVSFWKHFAIAVDGAIGPVLVDHSLWQAAGLALEANANSNGTYDGSSMVFTGWLGGNVTTYKLHDAADRTWLDTVFVDGQVTLRDPDGQCCAAWLGTRYSIPVAEGPTQSSPDPRNGQFLAPRPWVTFRLGGTLSYIRQWDFWGELDVIARGDLSRPGTTLPILDGGFNQTLVEIGLTRHFGSEP